ncbi:hypothetical protein RQP54_06060 [Curvibacter sp. APW13]|uniref:hypothetical protein n=1 Tax=Curvibacter sp. APW13 TaxID=3077236 RepID=UPI0028E05F34|nr:hypothetical protein [Curvibacter sp. APW13]MDT8990427.1 hypothetical protein [Curvibacter sp. APW13]
MHLSASDHSHPGAPVPGQSLAVLAQSLYLSNLLLAPGLAFAVLAWLWWRHRHTAPLLARQHLHQATLVSLVGGVLIVCLSGAWVAFGGLQSPWTWVVVLTYFVCIHGTLVLLGMFALTKAMAGQAWRYPLIGPRLL